MGKAGFDMKPNKVLGSMWGLFKTEFGMNASKALGGIIIVTLKIFNKLTIGQSRIFLANILEIDQCDC